MEIWRIISGTLQEAGKMAREAKLFASSAGSAVRAFLRFRANIPPRWIKNARNSRKRIEPEIVAGLRSFRRLQKDRPRARVAIRNAQRELRRVLDRWEMAYEKENFYRGIRVLLELQRDGMSRL
ncbi:MAG: hypothetical protein DMG94_02850 [Acidobacteria bacterium]|nr:MAG: hypothetical protein DMG94_02850 [Acidobacteriota bacterium]